MNNEEMSHKLSNIIVSIEMARNTVVTTLDEYEDIRRDRFNKDLTLVCKSDDSLQDALARLNAAILYAEYELLVAEVNDE